MKQSKLSNKKSEIDKLIKTIIVFLVYFIYSRMILTLLAGTGIDKILILFFGDFIFMLFIAFMYKKDIKEDFKNLSKNYSIGKLVRTIIMWALLILVLNIAMGGITESLIGDLPLDENTSTLDKLASLSFLYTAFKTMIFAVIAEELLFRESIRTVVKNKISFILISGILYTLMNFLYADLGIEYIGIYILMYFFPALLMSFAYIRNKDNILLIMLIKFMYNLIPFSLLVAELFNK